MIALLNDLILAAIWVGGIAYTVFTPAYLWWAFGSWNRTLVGWALASAATSAALLLDLTLLFRIWTPPILAGLWITLAVIALIAVGGCLKLAALAVEMRHELRRLWDWLRRRALPLLQAYRRLLEWIRSRIRKAP